MALLGKRALLIANPGSRRGAREVGPAVQALHTEGVDVDVIVTERRGHGGDVAKERAAGYELVFSLGGDGTAMEVIHAVAPLGRAVGVLPGGTGNLLARALGIPIDIATAVRTLLHGAERRIDLGSLGSERRFAVAAGVGLDAEMVARSPVELRRRYGVFAYVGTASRSLFTMPRFHVRATVDGHVIERDDCVTAMVVNMGSLFGGALTLGPNIAFDDGRLDLCLYCARNLADAAIVVTRLVIRDHRTDRLTAFATGTSITLETEPVRATQADGDLLEAGRLEATIHPGAATLLVPLRHG